jgi:hypothetical protein
MNLQEAVGCTRGGMTAMPIRVNRHHRDELPGPHLLVFRNLPLQLSRCPFPSVPYALINDSTNFFSTSHQSPQGRSSPAGILCHSVTTSEWTHGLPVSGCQYQTLKQDFAFGDALHQWCDSSVALFRSL